jgi:hypothetical protein
MFIEIDQGKFVNLRNVFSITFEPLNDKGSWLFHGSAITQATPHASTYKELFIRSRVFLTSEKAFEWLKSTVCSAAE